MSELIGQFELLRPLLRPKSYANALAAADTDKDGNISFEEFRDLCLGRALREPLLLLPAAPEDSPRSPVATTAPLVTTTITKATKLADNEHLRPVLRRHAS